MTLVFLEFRARFESFDQAPRLARVAFMLHNLPIIYPPFSKNVQTNIGREFRNLIERCFPPNHKLGMKGVVSKETVVLRRWGSSIQKFKL